MPSVRTSSSGYLSVCVLAAGTAPHITAAAPYGGGTKCHGGGCGIVFKLAPDGTETVLVAFGQRRGTNPVAALLKGRHGFLYGTTTAGGTNNDGVVFKIKE